MEAESVQCVVTSPPYYGLRDYQVEGQIGLEDTPEDYVAKMVEVFAEVKRVLKNDGVLWLNLGDSYGAQKGKGFNTHAEVGGTNRVTKMQDVCGDINVNTGLPPKNLIGIPWRVAFALQADGWWLRQDIIWHKPNPMPESVTDRCTKAHEYIFLMTKSAKYFYDADAIAEKSIDPEDNRAAREKMYGRLDPHIKCINPATAKTYPMRNKRSVWTMNTQPFPAAHFATFPMELPTTCIKAGSKTGDTILDPFAGAGTTLLAAKNLHCKAIGIELNPDYI
ncbi:MAG: site-specific DNA-methyltransferase [Proteobacteria bacterium]|nr:site-specific DNA-methyltransferase [Pseudomonadota bacterium]